MQPTRIAPSLFIVFATVLASSGCSYLIQTGAESDATTQVKRLRLPTSQAKEFTACLGQAGGMCPKGDSIENILAAGHKASGAKLDTNTAPFIRPVVDEAGRRRLVIASASVDSKAKTVSIEEYVRLAAGEVAAQRAREVLLHPAQQVLNNLFNAARESRSVQPFSDAQNSGAEPIVINVADFNNYLEKIEEATALNGWEALEAQAVHSEADSADKIRRMYINAYFKAYFRSGRFYALKLQGADLKTKVKERLADALPGLHDEKETYDSVAEHLFDKLKFEGDTRVLGKIATEGFITRGGQEIKIPAIDAELDLASGKSKVTKIDTTAVTSDLVRVLLHAIYDAHDRIPGVTNATGYSPDISTQLGTNDPGLTKVDAAAFGEIEERAARVELLVSTGVGRLVRGLGVVALNNEAIATAIETAAGVAARKHAEKALWCWQACVLRDSSGQKALGWTLPDETAINIRINGEPRRTFGKAKVDW